MRLSKFTLTVIVIILGVSVVYTARWFAGRLRPNATNKIALAKSKGNPKADLRITEFIDFQCPACAKGALLIKEYLEKYPSRMYVEVKYFPLSQMHSYALKSAVYAECAAQQDKFWPFQDLLVKKQEQWSMLLNVENIFKEMALEANLNLNEFEACVVNENIKKVVLSDKIDGESRGVRSTPTYFINGTKMVVGPKPLREELVSFFEGQKDLKTGVPR